MYAVNAGVPKTLIKYLTSYFARQAEGNEQAALLDIIDTPISPELLPATESGEIDQKTEDLVGPYELHDFFLYYILRYGFTPQRVFRLAKKAFAGLYDDRPAQHVAFPTWHVRSPENCINVKNVNVRSTFPPVRLLLLLLFSTFFCGYR